MLRFNTSAARSLSSFPGSAWERKSARLCLALPSNEAVAHTLVVIVYHMLSRGTPYRDLGVDYLDRLQSERLTRQLVKRLERLGHKVTLVPQPGAA